MLYRPGAPALEMKYCALGDGLKLKAGAIEGYASLFGKPDQGHDVVVKGAYGKALKHRSAPIRMLWQHNPAEPIGIWDEVREDDTGLWVKGRLLSDVQRGREALALLEAGAIDGLSIGYRTKRAEKSAEGTRLLHEIELWEVSVVTFPMLPEARISPSEPEEEKFVQDLADAFRSASQLMADEPCSSL